MGVCVCVCLIKQVNFLSNYSDCKSVSSLSIDLVSAIMKRIAIDILLIIEGIWELLGLSYLFQSGI